MHIPFISPLGFTITPALSSKYMKTPSFLRQGFRCRTTTAGSTVRTDEAHEHLFPCKVHNSRPLNSECRVLTLLSQVRLSLLHGGHKHVARSCCWQSVQTGSPPSDGNHIQVLGSSVVCAVHHGSHRQTQGHPELVSGRTSAPSLGRHGYSRIAANQSWPLQNTGLREESSRLVSCCWGGKSIHNAVSAHHAGSELLRQPSTVACAAD